MINVAIVEDEEEASNVLVASLNQYALTKYVEFNIKIFSNGELFLSTYRANYDVIFMDIELGSANGIEISKRMREIDETTLLIFVTNMAQYAIKGYEVNAFDFIVKPYDPFLFSLKMDRIINRLCLKNSKKIKVTTSKGIYSLNSSEIIYVETDGHHITIHTIDGLYESYGTLSKFEESLASKAFIRSNSCFLVNLRYVKGIEKNDLIVKDQKLQISRNKKKEVIRAINNYLGGSE